MSGRGFVIGDRDYQPVMLQGQAADTARLSDAVFWLDERQSIALAKGADDLQRMDESGRPGIMLAQIFRMQDGQWLVCVRTVDHELGLSLNDVIRRHQGAKPASEL